MPEAVASNSIPVSEDQPSNTAGKTKRAAFPGVPILKAPPPFDGLAPSIQRDFDAVQEMLRSYAMMMNVMLESGDDCSVYSEGAHLIHQLIMFRLDEVADQARVWIEDMTKDRYLKDPADPDLRQRVSEIVCAAYSAAGIDMDFNNVTNWPLETTRLYGATTALYMREMRAKLEGDTHLLAVGSLLPWLEMKIWREVVGEDIKADPQGEEQSLRNRLIFEQAQAGVAASEISQAFGIRRATVERIIGRLTATEEETRKAV